jgi:glutamate racemase
MKAGVFDSGVGGLTVVKSLLENQIFEKIFYYGDTARVPYGTKDKNTIIRYSLEALEYFENYDIDILIVACNSASAYALSELRQVATIPVVGVINSGILAVSNKNIRKDSSILVIGTTATIDSNLYEDGLKNDGFKNICSIATPLFVPLVEEEILNGAILDATLQHYFHNLNNIEVVILGCTHFPLLEDKISGYFNGAITIHSGDAIVQYLKSEYNCTKHYSDTKVEFFASSNPAKLKQVAQRWLDEPYTTKGKYA